MASVSLGRIMDRVSLVFDCATDDEATQLYRLLVSQGLDGRSFHINMSHEAEGFVAPEEQVRGIKRATQNSQKESP